MNRSRLLVVLGGVVVVLAVAVGAFLWFTRDDAPDELQIRDDEDASGEEVDAAGLDGTWTVVAGSGEDATVAGYRVQEVFAQGARRSTAAGRTNDVTGTVTVAGGEVTEAGFTVDMTTLTSDESRRDNRVRSSGIETDEFPEATFALTEPVALPTLAEGRVEALEATGDLTLHGETRSVTLDIEVKASGDAFVVQGDTPILFADYAIDPPNVGGFVEVDDNGSMEFVVNLARS